MKGWRAMRVALSHVWGMTVLPHSRETPNVSNFDMEEFEQRLADTERRVQVEERRLQILALEGEALRGHAHDGT